MFPLHVITLLVELLELYSEILFDNKKVYYQKSCVTGATISCLRDKSTAKTKRQLGGRKNHRKNQVRKQNESTR